MYVCIHECNVEEEMAVHEIVGGVAHTQRDPVIGCLRVDKIALALPFRRLAFRFVEATARRCV